MFFSRLIYYLSSIPTLIVGIKNWSTILPAIFSRSAQPFTVELRNGARFRVRTLMDIWILKEATLDRQYERASVKIQDGWTTLDIGAGIGDFAIMVAREHPNNHVYAFEPLQDSVNLFQENLKLNQIENVEVFPVAIGGETGMTELHAVTAEPVQYSTAAESAHSRAGTPVRTVTLDQAFDDLHLARCDYLKIDCEGAEFSILFNTSPTTLAKIKHICLEYHDGVVKFSHQDLVRFFETNGFQVKLSPNQVHRELGLMYAAKTGA